MSGQIQKQRLNYSNQAGTEPSEPVRSIIGSLNLLNEMAIELETSVSALERRLLPVMQPSPGRAESEKLTGGFSCELTERISMVGARLAACNELLREMESRVQV